MSNAYKTPSTGINFVPTPKGILVRHDRFCFQYLYILRHLVFRMSARIELICLVFAELRETQSKRTLQNIHYFFFTARISINFEPITYYINAF